MPMSDAEVKDVIRFAFPHDFGSTLTYLERSSNDLIKQIVPLSPYTSRVKLHPRILKIKSMIDRIDDEFDVFWEHHEDSDDLLGMNANFQVSFYPLFESIEDTAQEFSNILNKRVKPFIKRHDKRAKKAINLASETTDRITYFAKRSRYYIDGMTQLINLQKAKNIENTNLNRLVLQQDEMLSLYRKPDYGLSIIRYNRLPTIQVDYSHAFTWISNLVKNSIKYRKADNCRIRIIYDTGSNLSSKAKDIIGLDLPYLKDNSASFAIHFIDYGIGIEKDALKAVFKPFKRVVDKDSEPQFDKKDVKLIHSNRSVNFDKKYSGMGIGLALVERVVDLYDGNAYATSDYGDWTCITVELPNKLLID